jgi:hypothetical protein
MSTALVVIPRYPTQPAVYVEGCSSAQRNDGMRDFRLTACRALLSRRGAPYDCGHEAAAAAYRMTAARIRRGPQRSAFCLWA